MTVDRVKEIVSAVSHYTGVSAKDIRGRDRSKHASIARFVCWYVIRKTTGQSLPWIGDKFGRDHTSILHGLRRAEKILFEDPALETMAHELIEHFGSVKRPTEQRSPNEIVAAVLRGRGLPASLSPDELRALAADHQRLAGDVHELKTRLHTRPVRIVTSGLLKPKPAEPTDTPPLPKVQRRIASLAAAKKQLDKDLYSPGERLARERFERAAVSVIDAAKVSEDNTNRKAG